MDEVQETKNALWRREEQLRRWEASETNSELPTTKNRDESKVKFQDGCVFLAACSSGDRDEVSELLAKGADINTTNVDGLTALHQVRLDQEKFSWISIIANNDMNCPVGLIGIRWVKKRPCYLLSILYTELS